LNSDNFQAISTLVQFVFSVYLFVWVFRRFIWTKRKNRKGILVPYSYKIPEGYEDLCVNGDGLDGSFGRANDKSNLTLCSKNEPIQLESRKSELLKPQRDNERISMIAEGKKTNLYGLTFDWIQTERVTENFELNIITYLLDDKRIQIEVGCGCRTEDFPVFISDYELLIDSIQLNQTTVN